MILLLPHLLLPLSFSPLLIPLSPPQLNFLSSTLLVHLISLLHRFLSLLCLFPLSLFPAHLLPRRLYSLIQTTSPPLLFAYVPSLTLPLLCFLRLLCYFSFFTRSSSLESCSSWYGKFRLLFSQILRLSFATDKPYFRRQFPWWPFSYLEALHSPDAAQWVKAMTEEIDSLRENKTWELVRLPNGRKAIQCKWVFETKYRPNGDIDKFKAWLVAKGYTQKAGIDYTETFSPVVKFETIRIVMAITAADDLEIVQFNIKTAFLHGDIAELLYMEQPEGFVDLSHPDYVCLLRKALYRLKQSSRNWNTKFHAFLLQFGLTVSDADPCAYFSSQLVEPLSFWSMLMMGLYASPKAQILTSFWIPWTKLSPTPAAQPVAMLGCALLVTGSLMSFSWIRHITFQRWSVSSGFLMQFLFQFPLIHILILVFSPLMIILLPPLFPIKPLWDVSSLPASAPGLTFPTLWVLLQNIAPILHRLIVMPFVESWSIWQVLFISASLFPVPTSQSLSPPTAMPTTPWTSMIGNHAQVLFFFSIMALIFGLPGNKLVVLRVPQRPNTLLLLPPLRRSFGIGDCFVAWAKPLLHPLLCSLTIRVPSVL